MPVQLSPAATAFDAMAPDFDARFGRWSSVAAQRRAVRAILLHEFPAGGKILELGCGTGEDAAFLTSHGFRLFLTDPSPRMVEIARAKIESSGGHAEILAAEELSVFASRHFLGEREPFDGAFSNFAPLNCVADLASVARGLARLLKPGASAMLVVFGTFCIGEIVTEILRGRPEYAFRRFRRGIVPASVATRKFPVVYHRRSALNRAFAPWFVLEKRFGIGIAVPPSAAEPWMSRHPRLLAVMEGFDSVASRPLATFGDHVLYQFRRSAVE